MLLAAADAVIPAGSSTTISVRWRPTRSTCVLSCRSQQQHVLQQSMQREMWAVVVRGMTRYAQDRLALRTQQQLPMYMLAGG